MPAGSAVASTAQKDPDTATGRRVAVVAAGALLLVVYVLHAALPASPFALPVLDSSTIRDLVPQGWAFFTKSPRSVDTVVYRRDPAGSWRDITAGPLAQPQYAMGLDRMPRAQGTELALLEAALAAEAWQSCDRTPTECLESATATTEVPNRSNHHSVCGDVGLVSQEVLPWAWRGLPTIMPSRVARVWVTC